MLIECNSIWHIFRCFSSFCFDWIHYRVRNTQNIFETNKKSNRTSVAVTNSVLFHFFAVCVEWIEHQTILKWSDSRTNEFIEFNADATWWHNLWFYHNCCCSIPIHPDPLDFVHRLKFINVDVCSVCASGNPVSIRLTLLYLVSGVQHLKRLMRFR